MAEHTRYAVHAVLPGLEHGLAHGRIAEASGRVRDVLSALTSGADASGSTTEGAWATYEDASHALDAALRLGPLGAGCGVDVGDVVTVSRGPPVGYATWLAARLGQLARPGEILMPRAALLQFARSIPVGVGQYAAPPGLDRDDMELVVLRDFRPPSEG